MLKLPSAGLLRARALARVEAREEGRRNSRLSAIAARRLIFTRGDTAGATRVEIAGAADGTVGTAMFGGGGDATLPALPMPLGSLTELLRPPALPTPRMPLTPASCAKDLTDAVGPAANATADKTSARIKNEGLPMITLRCESD